MARTAEDEFKALSEFVRDTVIPGVWTWIEDPLDDSIREWCLGVSQRSVNGLQRVRKNLAPSSFSGRRYTNEYAREAYGAVIRPVVSLATVLDQRPDVAEKAAGQILNALNSDTAEELHPYGYRLDNSARMLFLNNAEAAHLDPSDAARELALWAIETQWLHQDGRETAFAIRNVDIGVRLLYALIARGALPVDHGDVAIALEPTYAAFDAVYGDDSREARDVRNRFDAIRTHPEFAVPRPSTPTDLVPVTTSTELAVPAAPRPKTDQERQLETALQEVDALVGLESVKASIHEFVDSTIGRRHRIAAGLPAELPAPGHFVFTGAPGTGKTTVARLIGRIQHSLGLLSKGHTIEVEDRSGLIAGYVGQTAKLTRARLEEAAGGVLFIDEAYELRSKGSSSNDFAGEALATIVSFMENNRTDFSLVLAGYPSSIEQLLQSNDGLRSRISEFWTFDDLTFEQMQELWEAQLAEDRYTMTPAAQDHMFGVLFVERSNPGFANARSVRTLYERTVRKQNARMGRMATVPTVEELRTIEKEDLPPMPELRPDATRGRDRDDFGRGVGDR
ncbi:MAG: AAA family ATPase [Acidimicrobiia bacterium]